MTPPPAALATNSSFNTSSKCPVRHTVFQLVPISLFMLNTDTFDACVSSEEHSVKHFLVRIALIR